MATAEPAKRTFMTDIWRKVIALILAILSWILIMLQTMTTRHIEKAKLHIEYDHEKYILPRENFEIDLNVLSFLPNSILNTLDFSMTLQLPPQIGVNGNGGVYPVILRDELLRKKHLFARIEEFAPQSLKINFDVYKEKYVPVTVRSNGKVRAGYQVEFKATPNWIKVKAPSELLPQLEEVRTEIMDIPAYSPTGFSQEVMLAPQANRQITTSMSHVIVRVNYRRIDGSSPDLEQRLWDRPVLVLNAQPPRFQLEAGQTELVVDLLVRGVDRMEEDKRNSYRPYIDLSEATEAGEYYAPVHVLRVEDEDKTVEPSPQTIRLNLRPADSPSGTPDLPSATPEATVPAPSPAATAPATPSQDTPAKDEPK